MHPHAGESTWSGSALTKQVANAIVGYAYFARGSVLLLDENADAKASPESAGAGRQYNGRLGKVDGCQVGVFLAITKDELSGESMGNFFSPKRGSPPLPIGADGSVLLKNSASRPNLNLAGN